MTTTGRVKNPFLPKSESPSVQARLKILHTMEFEWFQTQKYRDFPLAPLR